MVRTMAVIVAAVGALLFLVPASPPIVQPGPDPVAAAAAAAAQLGFEPAVVPPADLGEEWTVSYARVETTEGVVQWRLGYLTPEQRRVDVEQASAATVGWLLRDTALPQVAGEAAALADVLPGRGGAGLVSVAGTPWWRFERGDGTVALAREAGGTVMVVTVTSQRPTEDGERVAAALDDAGLAADSGEPTG